MAAMLALSACVLGAPIQLKDTVVEEEPARLLLNPSSTLTVRAVEAGTLDYELNGQWVASRASRSRKVTTLTTIDAPYNPLLDFGEVLVSAVGLAIYPLILPMDLGAKYRSPGEFNPTRMARLGYFLKAALPFSNAIPSVHIDRDLEQEFEPGQGGVLVQPQYREPVISVAATDWQELRVPVPGDEVQFEVALQEGPLSIPVRTVTMAPGITPLPLQAEISCFVDGGEMIVVRAIESDPPLEARVGVPEVGARHRSPVTGIWMSGETQWLRVDEVEGSLRAIVLNGEIGPLGSRHWADIGAAPPTKVQRDRETRVDFGDFSMEVSTLANEAIVHLEGRQIGWELRRHLGTTEPTYGTSAAEARYGSRSRRSELAREALQAGRSNGSILNFQRAVLIAPDANLTHYWLGRAFIERGELAKAEWELRRSLDIDPSSAVTRYRLSEVYTLRAQWAQAESELVLATQQATERGDQQLQESIEGRLALVRALAEYEASVDRDALRQLLGVAPTPGVLAGSPLPSWLEATQATVAQLSSEASAIPEIRLATGLLDIHKGQPDVEEGDFGRVVLLALALDQLTRAWRDHPELLKALGFVVQDWTPTIPTIDTPSLASAVEASPPGDPSKFQLLAPPALNLDGLWRFDGFGGNEATHRLVTSGDKVTITNIQNFAGNTLYNKSSTASLRGRSLDIEFSGSAGSRFGRVSVVSKWRITFAEDGRSARVQSSTTSSSNGYSNRSSADSTWVKVQ
ncbi:MAG: hypothetical protein AAFY15_00070 [Cyanobacteria bacterium J06648_11]